MSHRKTISRLESIYVIELLYKKGIKQFSVQEYQMELDEIRNQMKDLHYSCLEEFVMKMNRRHPLRVRLKKLDAHMMAVRVAKMHAEDLGFIVT